MKKGQVATEFLITYGWAIMLVLLAVSALFYFGFLDTDLFIEDTCFFGQNFGECDEFTRVGDKIFIKLTNNGLQNLTFHSCNVSVQNCETSCYFDEEDFSVEKVWEPYSQKVLSFSCSEMLDNFASDIELKFSLPESDREHVLKGRLIGSLEKQEDILGCRNPDANNYDPDATVDDGSCEVPGCVDNLASNFDSLATVDDGSCEYFPVITYWSVNGISGGADGEINVPITTELQFNFQISDYQYSDDMELWIVGDITNPTQVTFVNIFNDYCFPVMAGPGESVFTCGGDFTILCPTCVQGISLNNIPGASSPDTYSFEVQVFDKGNGNEQTNLNFNVNFIDAVLGCTDPSACNYDPVAEVDDGSCESTDNYYLDFDGDSFGDPDVSVSSCGVPDCDGPDNEFGNPTCYSNAHGDCDDTNSFIHPNIIEDGSYCFDGLDNDCDGFNDFCSVLCDEGDLPPGTSIDNCGIKESACSDGEDNDLDGSIDLCDSDCPCFGSAIKIGCECYKCDIDPDPFIGSVYCFDPGSSINLEFSLVNRDTGVPLNNCNSIEFHENLGTDNVYYYPGGLSSSGCSKTLNLDEALGNLNYPDTPKFYLNYQHDYSPRANCGFDIYHTGHPECS